MTLKLTRDEFIKFMGAKRLDNAKRSAISNGYAIETTGRGPALLISLEIPDAPEGYPLFCTVEEGEAITGEKGKQMRRKLGNGDNIRIGHLLFYRAEKDITDLMPENRIRYLFTVNPILASGFTYEVLGKMTGTSERSARWYVKKIAEEDGLTISESLQKFKTGYSREGHVYTLSLDFHRALCKAFNDNQYYSLEVFHNIMWERQFAVSMYQEKIINIENIHLMRKFETANPLPTLFPLKKESTQIELESEISFLTAKHRVFSKA